MVVASGMSYVLNCELRRIEKVKLLISSPGKGKKSGDGL
jgi:hypothetical protein